MDQRWFGHYRLERLLGSGGMGQVWLAHNTATDRAVALKVLPAELATDQLYRQRFDREARIAAQLRGPHLVTIHTFGEIDGRLFIDMEYIDGIDVATLLRDNGPMSPDAAVDIVAQMAAALDVVHRAGLIHRDIKPANTVVHPTGFVYLIDFGTAHHTGQSAVTATGQVIGTLPYMAPERFSGTADSRSDIYSLACVLYECLTGMRPFGDSEPARLIHDHLSTQPPRAAVVNPQVPAALDEVITRGMAKDPNQRYSSAGAFAHAARVAIATPASSTSEFIATKPLTVGTPHPSLSVTKTEVHNRRLAPAALVAVLAATIAVAFGISQLLGAETRNGSTSAEAVPSLTSRPPAATSTTASVPVAGQRCDPDTDQPSTAVDGTLLECIVAKGPGAQWVPSDHRDKPEHTKTDKPNKKDK
ncbi:serine/threonine-protein kinase [Nocardia sp. NPDC056000]|uniref:serine/threonine-protein kinase n=1 Tax=Nocardia sp. NPDC056000 TaxID=3345674 RepID=UPI0035D5720B